MVMSPDPSATGSVAMVKILFVCTGNICRSPTAAGVMQKLVADAGLEGEVGVDSAGTHSWHQGEQADLRSIRAAAKRGVDIGGHRARRVETVDFETFTHIVAMDRDHLSILQRMEPADGGAELTLMMDHAPEFNIADVPDPYFGAGDGFEHVLDLVTAAGAALLDRVRVPRAG